MRLLILLLLAAPVFSAEDVVQHILDSGRLQTLGLTDSERLAPSGLIAPGDAPLLRFRYLDGKRRQRFGDLDLVLDDAGH